MRGPIRGLAILCLVLMVAIPAWGLEEALWERAGTEAVERAAEDVLDAPLSPELDLEAELEKLGYQALDRLGEILREATGTGARVLVAALFASLLRSAGEGRLDQVTRLVGALAVTGSAVGEVRSLLQVGEETIVELNAFTQALMPALTASAAAAGNLTGSAARQMATLIVSDLLLRLMTGLLLPLVYLYLAACTGAEATGNGGIRGVADLIRWGNRTLLTWVLTLFTLYLSLSGILSGSADRAALKLTRFTISGLVPVVGGILSDATESLLVGAGLLRSAIGIYGTLAVVAFCLVPFLKVGVRYLFYKLAALLTDTLSLGSLGRLVGDVAAAFGMVLAMVGSAALVTLIAIITAIAGAVG